jgi:hypothetical protein
MDGGSSEMSRLERVLSVLILISTTFLVTEWVHYRAGTPPIFQLWLGPRVESDVAATLKNRDANSVTEGEFQTYLHVLESMQVDSKLSIEDAVDAEHVTLDKFRELEQRVQRNEVLIDRARHTLRERAETLWNARGARNHG